MHRLGELGIPMKYVCVRIAKVTLSDRATQGQQIASDSIFRNKLTLYALYGFTVVEESKSYVSLERRSS